ncbi:DNA polymerase iota isoform X2 [Amblyraja radiata]|uniref:DNA polymerase iota isoform X2 n=1 Tax=Amblyraja radiata TaxID=386614 RepID=UPI0014041E16|nr:DNA polymerase iota isoform X2 [Amblyraja radiata]
MELNASGSAADHRFSLQEEEEEEEREWCCTIEDSNSNPLSPAAASRELTGDCDNHAFQDPDILGFRVIVHIDLDCYYAQVETLRHPEYRGMPLAVHQKHLVVTCNYEARKYGVNKIMSVSVAKDRCPQLILICGEDLTPYRDISYKITELLEEFSPLVERLGFDENFIDITDLVEKRLQQIGSGVVPADFSVSGHVYSNQALNTADGKHVRLALGSKIGAEMRTAICDRIGLTSSAGITSNKLLAKLVSGTFKPNQQTTLFPESIQDRMGNLLQLKQVPGIGPKTVKRLEYFGIHTIHALQTFPLDLLEKDLGVITAQRIHKLSFGEDDSPVTPRGPPQSLSNEDSFRKCSSLVEIRMKLEELQISLLIRLRKDGRVPRTIRLSIRRSSASNKWFNRESRQCPVPNQLMQKLNTGACELVTPLVDILMKLFQKMVDTKCQFFISLLNVCFSNLIQSTMSSPLRGSIGFYLTQKSPGKLDTSPKVKASRQLLSQRKGSDDVDLADTASPLKKTENHLESASVNTEDAIAIDPTQKLSNTNLPPEIDFDVFKELPINIQKEIITDASTSQEQMNYHRSHIPGIEKALCKSNFTFRSPTEDQRKYLATPDPESNPAIFSAINGPGADFSKRTSVNLGTQCALNDTSTNVPDLHSPGEALQSAKKGPDAPTDQNTQPFPTNVDVKVFSELPAELQKELLTDWKRQRTVLKVHVAKRGKKVKSSTGARHPQNSPKSNSILKYFSKR